MALSFPDSLPLLILSICMDTVKWFQVSLILMTICLCTVIWSQQWVKYYHYCPSTRMASALNNPRKLLYHQTNETRPKQLYDFEYSCLIRMLLLNRNSFGLFKYINFLLIIRFVLAWFSFGFMAYEPLLVI